MPAVLALSTVGPITGVKPAFRSAAAAVPVLCPYSDGTVTLRPWMVCGLGRWKGVSGNSDSMPFIASPHTGPAVVEPWAPEM